MRCNAHRVAAADKPNIHDRRVSSVSESLPGGTWRARRRMSRITNEELSTPTIINGGGPRLHIAS